MFYRMKLCCVATMLGAAVLARADEPVTALPSPDWRDQIIYLVMIDRFNDGDARNNDQGAGEYDPRDGAKFSGGDLAGIRQQLDYVRGLGATALWVTPPVANQWWDGQVKYGGYHGYWGENFKAVDKHFGTLADYRQLADALHRRGMYLIQDIVLNHTGNFFSYDRSWRRDEPGAGYHRNTRSVPVAGPSQYPFSLNDPRDPVARAADIYHWTPSISDFSSQTQMHEFQLAELDDLNTDNPVVARALRDSYGYWIREAGVDAFRVDTALYLKPEFFPEFLHSEDREAPGILRVAKAQGKSDFLVFGEGFAVDKPYAEDGARRIEQYMHDAKGNPRMSGMINFPLYGSLGDVFARGQPSHVLGDRISRMMALHPAIHRMPSFVDNHDVERFLASGDERGLRQALLAIMTLPGIPTLYYGTEQGFREQRAAMFATGYGAGGQNHFDTRSPWYRYIAALTTLRREHRVFSRGKPVVLADNPSSAGALAYRMEDGAASALVVFNSAATPVLLDGLATGYAPGTELRPVFQAQDGQTPPTLVVGAGGRVNLVLPARGGSVWLPAPGAGEAPVAASAAPSADAPRLNRLPARVNAALDISGHGHPGEVLQLALDGRIRAEPITVGADGQWRTRLVTDGLDEASGHRLLVFAPASGRVSEAEVFRVTGQWRPVLDYRDPEGDDRGASGRYRYPQDGSWNGVHSLDLRAVQAWVSGQALRLDITLRDMVAEWGAPQDFDHLALTVFLELPGVTGGARDMPGQFATLPGGMRWQRRLRLHGWGAALFGASADKDGIAIAEGMRVSVDRAHRRLRVILTPEALGWPSSLSGARLYVSTWDYDGGFRPLHEAPGAHVFGGGAPDAPRVMDDTPVLILP